MRTVHTVPARVLAVLLVLGLLSGALIGVSAAVREDAQKAGLYGSDSSMATGRPLLRQQAALMAWNALNAFGAPVPVTAPTDGGTSEPPAGEGGTASDDDDNETSMMPDF